MRRMVTVFAALVMLLVVACGGSEEVEDHGGTMVDRVLRLGEDQSTIVEVVTAAVPAELSVALNPEMTAETPASELIGLRVHRPEDIVGSFMIERPDGIRSFWLIYDHAESAVDVETAMGQELNEMPWQITAGQSTDTESGLRFQSTVSGDIDGTAIIRSIRDVDHEEGPLTSVVYILEVQAAQPPQEQPFVLPGARPIPSGFPAPELVFDGTIPITVLWGASADGQTYQLVLLTRESSFEVAEEYANVLETLGWQVVNDRAVGFATVLDFEADDGAMVGTITTDTFADDDDFTSVLIELRVGPVSNN
jgi:hypothetical protein